MLGSGPASASAIGPVETHWDRVATVVPNAPDLQGLDSGALDTLFLGTRGQYVSLPRPGGSELIRIDGLGDEAFRIHLDFSPSVKFLCETDRVCTSTDSALLLFDPHTGQLAGEDSPLPGLQTEPRSRHSTADGSLLWLRPIPISNFFPPRWRVYRRDIDSGIETGDWISGAPIAVGPPGAIIDSIGNGTGFRILRLLQDAENFGDPVPLPDILARQGQIEPWSGWLDEQERLFIAIARSEPGARTVFVERYSSDTRDWSVPVLTSTAEGSISTQIIPGEGVINVLTGLGSDRILVQLDASSGQILWQTTEATALSRPRATIAGHRFGRIAVSASKDTGTSDLIVSVLDAADGSLQVERSFDCLERACIPKNTSVNEAGGLDAVGTRTGQVTSFRYDNVLEPDTIVAAQPGLDGAWFAPELSGQGVMQRWIAESETLFLAWFVFDRHAQALRWFTLQTTLDPQAKEVDVPLIENEHGAFAVEASPPAQVGQARLRFISCAEAVLDYRFDAGVMSGASGSTRLNRLLPAGAPCLAQNGELAPAGAAYDPAMTGIWYDPAAPGQGLDVLYQADTGGTGFLFGAWFTFQPVADPHPATAPQHWFTLQGLEQIAAGVRTQIVETIAGGFESRPAGGFRRVGEADLIPRSCERLDLHYRFDEHADVGPFAGMQGRIELHRLGQCPPLP